MTKQALHELNFDRPITRWDEALPLGNGMIGCLVWGNGSPLRFSLDRGDLWDTRVAEETLSPDYTYAHLIELVRSGEYALAESKFGDFYSRPAPTKIPPGRFELNFGKSADRIGYKLSLARAEAEITLVHDGVQTTVGAFLDACSHTGHLKISGNGPLSDSFPQIAIVPPAYAKASEDGTADKANIVENNELASLGYPAPDVYEQDGLAWYVQRTCGHLEFAIAMAEKQVSETCREAVYTVAVNTSGADWRERAKERLLKALEAGYDSALERHMAWWNVYWSRSSLSLPDADAERQWYVTNYLFGSCSRKGAPPMPLQGVWTADGGLLPPWKGDYHHDLNTQASYWHYMKANHLEEGEAFIDLLWRLRPQAREFARSFYDAPGICLPAIMSLSGKPLGSWSMYSTQITCQIWLSQAFDHYWRYTGDREFLQEKAYVYFSETAACIMRWLTPDPTGKLQLPLSASPEIHNNTPAAWLTPNSNHDLALLHYLFRTLAEMADTLDVREEAHRWREIGARLPELAVDERHVLMLNANESLRESHRHLAHAMAVYPLLLLDYEHSPRDRQIIDATVRDLESLGKGQWIGFAYGWMANIYAIQGNGEAAAFHLKLFRDHFCSDNGFNLNGDFRRCGISVFHYRPFTLEGNMAAADALQEMLLKNDHGVIRVFPAVPASWKQAGVRFERLRGGCVLVSAEYAGTLRRVVLETERPARIALRNDFDRALLTVETAGAVRSVICEPGANLDITLQAGERCAIG